MTGMQKKVRLHSGARQVAMHLIQGSNRGNQTGSYPVASKHPMLQANDEFIIYIMKGLEQFQNERMSWNHCQVYREVWLFACSYNCIGTSAAKGP